MNKQQLIMTGCIFGFILGPLYFYEKFSKESTPEKLSLQEDSVEIDDRMILIKQNGQELGLRRGKKIVKARFVAAAVQPHSGSLKDNFGANSTVVVIKNQNARRYVKENHGKKQCGAGFMNSSSEQKTLYGANDAVRMKLRQWHRMNPYRIANWEDVQLSGSCLNRVEVFKSNKWKSDSKPQFIQDDPALFMCSFILVEDIKVSPANLI